MDKNISWLLRIIYVSIEASRAPWLGHTTRPIRCQIQPGIPTAGVLGYGTGRACRKEHILSVLSSGSHSGMDFRDCYPGASFSSRVPKRNLPQVNAQFGCTGSLIIHVTHDYIPVTTTLHTSNPWLYIHVTMTLHTCKPWLYIIPTNLEDNPATIPTNLEDTPVTIPTNPEDNPVTIPTNLEGNPDRIPLNLCYLQYHVLFVVKVFF